MAHKALTKWRPVVTKCFANPLISLHNLTFHKVHKVPAQVIDFAAQSISHSVPSLFRER